MRYLKVVLLAQGIYYILTGIWPLVDVDSFMLFTGQKTDIWLVKAMSCLFCAIGISLILGRKEKNIVGPLSILSAFSLAVIDFYYSSEGVISEVYKIDGAAQLIFFIAAVLSIRTKQDTASAKA